MATYVILSSFTAQGIEKVKDSPDRLAAFIKMAKKMGVNVKHCWYTVGPHDMAVVVEGADEDVTAALLKLGSLGNVRTTSMRAYSADEMKAILKKAG